MGGAYSSTLPSIISSALDRIFKINLEETDFFEESETRPELIIEGKVDEYAPVGETQRTLFAKTTSTKKRSIKKRNMFPQDIEKSLELEDHISLFDRSFFSTCSFGK